MKVPVLQAPLLFISDVHLGGFSIEKNEQIQRELLEVMDYCQQNNIHIALLGDLFDYWMEYPDYVPPLGQKLLDRFKTFNDRLGPSLFVTGNHDNWTRNHFRKKGFYLEHECFMSTFDDKKVMLLHGDGLADRAHGLTRPLFHRLLRNTNFIRGYQKLLAPKTGIALMKYFSRLNRQLNSSDGGDGRLSRWARKKLRDSDIDIIICGHDHRPRRKHFPFGTYINLGTFYQHRTMAFYNNHRFSLVAWEKSGKKLQPFRSTTSYNTSTLKTINE